MRRRSRRTTGLAVAAVLAVAVGGLTTGCSLDSTTAAKAGSLAEGHSLKGATFTVGSKEFTEQLILCHITSLALKSAGATTHEKCGLQGSNTTRTALDSGSIDMYWEYTGTAWVNYLKHTTPINDSARQYQAVAKEDLADHHVAWLDPTPANDTYAIVVKTSRAQQLGVTSLSQYAALAHSDPAKAAMCVASEFAGRSDGLPGLEKAYGFTVPKGRLATLAEGAIYNATAKGDPCTFGEAASTDGRISALHLTVLKDDKHFFPVYNTALTVRASVLKAHPALAKVINPIAHALTDQVLQQLNGDVDVKGQDPADVAQTWLESKGFIGK